MIKVKINCDHNCNLDVTLKPRHNRHDLKLEEFLPSALSPKVDWMERERMASSGL